MKSENENNDRGLYLLRFLIVRRRGETRFRLPLCRVSEPSLSTHAIVYRYESPPPVENPVKIVDDSWTRFHPMIRSGEFVARNFFAKPGLTRAPKKLDRA